jgi:hypothetical protein
MEDCRVDLLLRVGNDVGLTRSIGSCGYVTQTDPVFTSTSTMKMACEDLARLDGHGASLNREASEDLESLVASLSAP